MRFQPANDDKTFHRTKNVNHDFEMQYLSVTHIV